MPDKDLNNLAARIAEVLKTESGSRELSSLGESIEKINERLDRIEQKLHSPNSNPKISVQNSSHPSYEKFTRIEMLADEIIGSLEKEKTCTFEANDKPCDNCSMCSTRGF